MDIFLTGATGFVGRAVCRELIAKGYRVRCLTRKGSASALLKSPLVVPVPGDLFNQSLLTDQIRGCDAVIHLVGIIREFPAKGVNFKRLHLEATASIVAASQAAGVKRYLHMSANGTGTQALSAYHQTKWLAEEEVRNSQLEWTIFRPSLIYGAEDQFINLISGLIRKLPLMPVMGDGNYCLQPVPVETVALGFTNALAKTSSIYQTYHCGGRDCLSYNQLLDEVSLALGKQKVHKIHQPLSLMRPLVSLLQHLPFFPMTSDQLQMLIEGNCCDIKNWETDLELNPPDFRTGLSYLKKA